MRDIAILFIHLLVTIARLFGFGSCAYQKPHLVEKVLILELAIVTELKEIANQQS